MPYRASSDRSPESQRRMLRNAFDLDIFYSHRPNPEQTIAAADGTGSHR